MRRMPYSGVVACGLAALLVSSQTARANVYAAHLAPAANTWDFTQSGPLTLSYRLNQPATGVTVEVYRASAPATVIKSIPGTAIYGENSVLWDGTDTGGQPVAGAGDYKFRVIAEDSVGYGTWTNITPTSEGNEIRDAQFAGPTGVAVNRFPSSPSFGRIYVSNGSDSLTTPNPSLTTGDGLFLLNSDLTFRGGSATTAAAAANTQLVTLRDPAADTLFVSPWKISINADNPDEIVMGDFRNTFENCWIFDGEGQNAYRILDSSTTGPTTAGAYNHGNIIFAMLTGIGAERKLWVIDEDKDVGTTVVAPVGGGFDVIRHDIGTNSVNHTAQGTEIINGGSAIPGGGNLYTDREFRWAHINGTRKMFFACRRSNNTDPNMAAVCYNVDEAGAITGHAWSKLNTAMSSATGIIWTLTGSVAVDEARNRLAIARDGAGSNPSRVAILNPEDGAFVTFFTTNEGNGTLRSMDFDAAGNLYTVDITDKHLRMWSPPDGPNSYTTPYHGFIAVNCDFPPPTIISGPTDQQVCPGVEFSYTVTADGHGSPLAYEWRKGATVVGNGPTLQFNPVTVSDSGTYTVTVTGCSSVTSEPATLTVVGLPIISDQPDSAGARPGEDAVFTVVATTAGATSYQWKQTIGEVTTDVGTDSPVLTIADVTTALNGAQYHVVVTDLGCNSTNSSSQATLNVLAPPCSLRFADTDGDTDVDQADFGILQQCFTGDSGAAFDPVLCGCLDHEAPFGAIDENDLGAFMDCVSGPAIPASPTCGAAVTFEDDFDTPDSLNNWSVRSTTDDFVLTIGYDYSALGIPPAPGSDGTTRGMLVSVNDRDDADVDPLEAAAAFTVGTFTGDYTLQFDLWLEYGGSFTTEHAIMGVNAEVPDLLTVPTVGAINGPGVSPLPLGYLFAVDPDSGDNWRDYRTYRDGGELLGTAGGYAAGNQDATTGIFPAIFPVPKNVFPGVPGNTSRLAAGTPAGWGWALVQIQQKGTSLTWKVNGTAVAVLENISPVSGHALLGHMDLYASVNNAFTFVVFDNVIVTTP